METRSIAKTPRYGVQKKVYKKKEGKGEEEGDAKIGGEKGPCRLPMKQTVRSVAKRKAKKGKDK